MRGRKRRDFPRSIHRLVTGWVACHVNCANIVAPFHFLSGRLVCKKADGSQMVDEAVVLEVSLGELDGKCWRDLEYTKWTDLNSK
jgi:hypothetical protein